MYKTVNILSGQSLFDIAAQEFGTTEAAVSIAHLNNLSLSNELTPGTVIKLPEVTTTNDNILTYYKQHNLKPATAKLSDEILELVADESIDGGGQTPPIIPYDPTFSEEFG